MCVLNALSPQSIHIHMHARMHANPQLLRRQANRLVRARRAPAAAEKAASNDATGDTSNEDNEDRKIISTTQLK